MVPAKNSHTAEVHHSMSTFYVLREVKSWRAAYRPHKRKAAVLLYSFLFFSSHLLSSPFYSPSLLVVTQIRGHILNSRLFSPLPTTVRALHFYREKISALSSLVDSRRIVLTHARRSQLLTLLFIFANKSKISPRRDSNSRTNTINSTNMYYY